MTYHNEKKAPVLLIKINNGVNNVLFNYWGESSFILSIRSIGACIIALSRV